MKLWIMLCVLAFSAAADPDGSKEAAAAASTSLNAFLEKIPVGREAEYGFRDRAEFSRAVLGKPIQLFTANPDTLISWTDPEKKGCLLPMDEWKIPIVVDGEYRSLLTVARIDGVLKTVELGGEVLAKEMETLCKSNSGGRTAIFRIYQLKSDYVVIDRQDKSVESGEFYPLNSARSNIGGQHLTTGRPYAFKDVLPQIRRRFVELPDIDRR